ncbi:hypothetical protein L8O51_11075 [Enterobacter roggenkampii]|uniref:hypothetical protein n=1 Tax=Enterobacter roggenkampii TaxID=1812935 RepID=UPI002004A5A3|nr:hypothetical protein [Enterobacter roggenkampii]MCK7121048.1 hypothetical protein [Enterobacter roggenkampii]
MENSRTIKNLKAKLIKELPFFPDTGETKNELEKQGLNGILIAYLHWKTRVVPSRKRKVQIAPEVTSDPRWKTLKTGINGLFEKVRNGDDLFPHLSLRAHRYGYTPIERIRSGEVDPWADKDQILNTKGFYHFHLNMQIQHTGLAVRSDDVLFAFVSRDKFHAVGIFNHSVFEMKDESGEMPPERKRMWDLHKKHVELGMKPGTIYMNNPITTSGHPLNVIRVSDFYTAIIRENDPKLEDRDFVNNLYHQGKMQPPKRYNLEWMFNGLDLIIFDKKTDTAFILYKGSI